MHYSKNRSDAPFRVDETRGSIWVCPINWRTDQQCSGKFLFGIYQKNIYQKCIRRYIQIHPRYANIYQDIQNSTLRRGRPARPRSGPGGAAPLPLRILYILVHIVVCLGYIWMRLGAHEAWCFTQLFIGCSCIHACIYVCMYVNHFIPTSESCGCFGCWDIEYISY